MDTDEGKRPELRRQGTGRAQRRAEGWHLRCDPWARQFRPQRSCRSQGALARASAAQVPGSASPARPGTAAPRRQGLGPCASPGGGPAAPAELPEGGSPLTAAAPAPPPRGRSETHLTREEESRRQRCAWTARNKGVTQAELVPAPHPAALGSLSRWQPRRRRPRC